jgi:hypothetical protein
MSLIFNFPYSAEELSAFSLSMGTFIILLKNQQIVRYRCEDTASFTSWLEQNNVRNVNIKKIRKVKQEKKYTISPEWLGQLVLLIALPFKELVKDTVWRMWSPKVD